MRAPATEGGSATIRGIWHEAATPDRNRVSGPRHRRATGSAHPPPIANAETTPMSLPRRSLRFLPGLLLLAAAPAAAQGAPPVQLFRVTTTRGEVTMGFTADELDRLGSGPAVDRLARALAREGQISGWHYAVGRAADGSTRLATRERIAVMRQDGVTIQPYAAALPIALPPSP
jgi:hypothetical protein